MTEKNGLASKTVYTYALGDFCFTFFILFVGYYLMFFLTDVIKFPTKLAASIYSLVQVFETAGIIIGGIVIERARIKGGKYRPWLLMGGCVCAVFTTLFFTKLNISMKLYAFVFPLLYLIAYWGYNFMWVAFRALPGKMCRNQNDVMSVTVAGQQGAVAASLIFGGVGVKLLYGFESIEIGYIVSNVVYGVLIVVCMAAVFKVSKPFDDGKSISDGNAKKVSLKDDAKCFTGPIVPYFISSVLRNSSSVAVPALMVYYFNYVLDSPAGMSTYLSVVSVLQVAAVLLLKPITKYMSKTAVYKLTGIISVVSMTVAYFIGDNTDTFIFLMSLNNFCMVLSGGMANAFITDIADYNEYVRGINCRSFTVSLSGAANTVASLVGGAVCSFGLAFIGYDSAAALQSAEVAGKIRFIVTVGTAALVLISLVPFMFYKLTDKKMDEVYELKRETLK